MRLATLALPIDWAFRCVSMPIKRRARWLKSVVLNDVRAVAVYADRPGRLPVPKGPNGRKRPADVIGNANRLV
jgi:hypothetical protein